MYILGEIYCFIGGTPHWVCTIVRVILIILILFFNVWNWNWTSNKNVHMNLNLSAFLYALFLTSVKTMVVNCKVIFYKKMVFTLFCILFYLIFNSAGSDAVRTMLGLNPGQLRNSQWQVELQSANHEAAPSHITS